MNLIILLLSEVLHSDDPSSAAAENADDTSTGESTCYVDLDVSDPRLLVSVCLNVCSGLYVAIDTKCVSAAAHLGGAEPGIRH